MASDDGSVGDALLHGHFIAQADRPGETRDVDALTAVQRALLINDGTVTGLLAALAREPITVDVLDQRTARADGAEACRLDLSADAEVVARRVSLTGRQSSRVHAVAASILVPARLPASFIGALSGNPEGLGGVLDDLRLETRRELLWFGVSDTPGWARAAGVREPTLLTRSYRVVVGGVPAILITERFPTRPASVQRGRDLQPRLSPADTKARGT